MTEPLSNLIGICKECGDKRREDFQKKFNKYSLKVGDFVKKEFQQGEKKEHMWVLITGLKENSIMGILYNEPILVDNVKEGEEVEVKFKEIEDYLTNDR